MKKDQYKLLAVILIIIFLLVAMVGMLWYYGYIRMAVEPTTTTTVVPVEGDFIIDNMIGGNHENGIPMWPENKPYVYKIYEELKFNEENFYTQAAVSGSGTIVIYNYATLEQLASLTFSSGTITSTKKFSSGQHLKFKVTESGYVTYYGSFTVPYTEDSDTTTLDLTVKLVAIPTSWEQTLAFSNDTAIADAGTLSTDADLTASKAELVFKNNNAYDDTGYVTSSNFLKNVAQNAYFVLHFTGAGTDSVVIDTAESTYGKKIIAADNDVWIYWLLSDLDLSRDILSDGSTADPNGRWETGITLELSGIAGADDVTVTYGIVYYGDADYLHSNNNWAPQSGHTLVSDTFHIKTS